MSHATEMRVRRDIRRALGPAALDTIDKHAEAIGSVTAAVESDKRLRCEFCSNQRHFRSELGTYRCAVCDLRTRLNNVEESAEQGSERIWASLTTSRGTIDVHTAILCRGFWGRLRWLFTGR